MKQAIDETDRRRAKQVLYNTERGIDPQPLRKKIADITDQILREEADTAELIEQSKKKRPRDGKAQAPARGRKGIASMAYDEIMELVIDLDAQMKNAAAELQFELAARIRDEISELKYELRQMEKAGHA